MQSSTSPPLIAIPFHGDEIITFKASGRPHVAMRRIVENMGLDWARQSVKLTSQVSKFNCCHMPTVGADGRARAMLCMPVDKLPLWLATINPNKVRDPAVRGKVERYQAESAIALHDYWTKGAAIRGDATRRSLSIKEEMAALRRVREARLTYGIRAAQHTWITSGLPLVEGMLHPPQDELPFSPPPGERH